MRVRDLNHGRWIEKPEDCIYFCLWRPFRKFETVSRLITSVRVAWLCVLFFIFWFCPQYTLTLHLSLVSTVSAQVKWLLQAVFENKIGNSEQKRDFKRYISTLLFKLGSYVYIFCDSVDDVGLMSHRRCLTVKGGMKFRAFFSEI